MRIAYLGQMADIATENGISKKLATQAQAWARAGHEVHYFALAPTTQVWRGLTMPATVLPRGNPLRRAFRSRELSREIVRWQPEVIYFRYAHHSPGLSRLFRTHPAIAEINSNDRTEYSLTLSLGRRVYHRLTRSRILRTVSGFVAVTNELATQFGEFGRPSLAIGNSIALADHPVFPSAAPARVKIAFLGTTGAPWHGLDRIAELAALLPSVDFELIGITAEAWAALVSAPPSRNIRLHGPLPRTSYTQLLAECVAALGSLALYRNQMEEACSLKVRECLAGGLPVIGAYRDTDIPDDADYFLHLPNNAEPLAPWRDRIAAFINAWRGRRVPRSAIAHLDVSVKEAQRLAFMEKIIAEFRSHHG